MTRLVKITLLFLCAIVAQSCSVIDDDLSNCDKALELDLEVRLHTQLDLELNQQLTADQDNPIRQLLYEQLKDIFSDQAQDIDAFIYRDNSNEVATHINEVINSNQKTYTISLPMDNYDAIALANIDNNAVVNFTGNEINGEGKITVPADTVNSQRTGLFAARKEITITSAASQTVKMTLRQVNSAVALLLDHSGVELNKVEVFVEGTASDFMVADSSFIFNKKIVARANLPQNNQPNQMPSRAQQTTAQKCFTAVTLPSVNTPNADASYYNVVVYATNSDGTITRTELAIPDQLPAGHLRVIKAQLQGDGRVQPTENTNIGVTVQLDWQQGGEHEIIL